MPVVITVSSSIVDWTEVDHGDHILTPEKEVGLGTEESPYTVDQLAEKAGETAVWSTGIIVGADNDGITTRAGEATTKDNILIAAEAGAELADAVMVDLTGNTELQARLNLIDHADLLGVQIKVKGDIVERSAGAMAIIENITAEEGGKDPVEPEPEPEGTKISDIIAKYKDKDIIDEGTVIVATVVSDYKGKNMHNQSVAVSQGTEINSGITLRTPDAHEYELGSVLEVDVSGHTYAVFNHLYQIQLTAETVVTVKETGKVVEPIKLTDLKTIADYQSMLVSVEGAQAVKTGVALKGSHTFETEAGKFDVFNTNYSAFADDMIPTGNGTLVGIATMSWAGAQISPRNNEDIADLTGDRFGDVEWGEVSFTPAPVTQGAELVDAAISIPYEGQPKAESAIVSVTTTDSGIENVTDLEVALVQGSGEVVIPMTGTPATAETITMTITGLAGLTANTVDVEVLEAGVEAVQVGWDMQGIPEWGLSEMDATLTDPSLKTGPLTKNGFTESGNAGKNNWGSTDFSENTEENHLTAPVKFATVTVASEGKKLSLESITTTIRMTRVGPRITSVQYSTDGTTFKEAGRIVFDRPASTTTFPAETVSLAEISELQEITNTVTIRLVPIGKEGEEKFAGNWYLTNAVGAHALTIEGSVSDIE